MLILNGFYKPTETIWEMKSGHEQTFKIIERRKDVTLKTRMENGKKIMCKKLCLM